MKEHTIRGIREIKLYAMIYVDLLRTNFPG